MRNALGFDQRLLDEQIEYYLFELFFFHGQWILPEGQKMTALLLTSGHLEGQTAATISTSEIFRFELFFSWTMDPA
jgi:hypothetical protein